MLYRDAIARSGDQALDRLLSLLPPNGAPESAGVLTEFTPLSDALTAQCPPSLQAAALLMVHVCDPPTLAAVPLVLPSAAHLFTALEPELTTLITQTMKTLREILHALARQGVYEILPNTPKALAPKLDTFKKTAPLCGMHLLGRVVTYQNGQPTYTHALSPVYRKFALPCHLAIRRLEKRRMAGVPSAATAAYPTIYVAALVCRYLLQYLPKTDPFADPGELSDAELTWLRGNLLRKRPRTKTWPDTVAAYLRTLEDGLRYDWALAGTSPTTRPTPRRATRVVPSSALPMVATEHSPLDTQDGPAVGGAIVTVNATDTDVLDAALAAGEAPDEYLAESVETDSGDGEERGARALAKRTTDYYDRDMVQCMFAANRVQLHEYAQLYALRWPSRRIRRDVARQVQLISKLMIHLGRPLRQWRHLRLAPIPAPCPVPSPRPEPADAGQLFLDPFFLAVWFWLPPDWPGYRRDVSLPWDGVVRPTSRWVCLPLPPVLHAEVLAVLKDRPSIRPEIGAGHGSWAFPDAEAPQQPISEAAVQAAFAAAGIADPARLVRRLSNSFVTLYCVRHRLSPVYAAYIQGRVERFVKTKLWYAHVDATRLIEHFWAVNDAVDATIRTAAGLEAAARAHTPVLGLGAFLQTLGGYGSRAVPTTTHLKAALGQLGAALRRDARPVDREGEIRYHNRFMALCYILLHLLIAARPVHDAEFIASLSSDELSRLFQEDKYSPTFFEARAFLRNARVVDQLAQLQLAYRRALAIESFKAGQHAALGSPVLFFIGQNGAPLPVTADGVEQVLRRWPEGDAAWPYPANVGRHLQVTEHVERGVDWDVANHFLGHERAPREALGLYSMMEIPSAEAAIDGQVTAIAEAYGIEVAPFAMERKGSR